MNSSLSGQHLVANQMYPSFPASNMQHDDASLGMESFADALGTINLGNAGAMGHTSSQNTPMQSNTTNTDGFVSNKALGPFYYQLQDGTIVYSGPNAPQAAFPQYSSAHYNWALQQQAQYQQTAYPNIAASGISLAPNTPRGQTWMPSQGVPPVPELMAARRTSWSSKEESPQTPSMSNWHAQILTPSHTPATWGSPSAMVPGQPFPYPAKSPDGNYVVRDFEAWVHEYPPIPEPVPALHSGADGGRGTLDKILDNREGTTNVYVRGLQPDTTDEFLYCYGRRFGDIESQKAIIDHSNGTCKG